MKNNNAAVQRLGVTASNLPYASRKALIAQVEAAVQSIPDETQRRKALLRWHSVNRIPADNAFVVHVAQELNIDHRTVWAQILAK